MAKPEAQVQCQGCKLNGPALPHPFRDEAGRCLYHSEKEGKKEKFEEAVYDMIVAGNCNFMGFIFPPGFSFPPLVLRNAIFSEAIFQGNADFSGTSFEGKADFAKAIFQGTAYFRAVIFCGYANFLGVTFEEDASFEGSIFQEVANFQEVIFKRAAYFVETNFQGSAEFRHIIFQDKAVFQRATFKENVVFFPATFQANADFSEAAFQGVSDFLQTRFQGHAHFWRASFQGPVSFLSSAPKEKEPTFASGAHFLAVNLSSPEKATFRGVNLSNCSFFNTDLGKINFIQVAWAKQGWRDALYDEPISIKAGDYASPAQMYRELKINYEEKRDWVQANHFHYGQMEMQRKDKSRPLWGRIILNIYRVLSGYGSRCDWTVYWLVGLTLAFGLAYAYFDSSFASWDSVLMGMEQSVKLMTIVHRVSSEEMAAPWWLTTLNSITGASLIALLVLALRRRFRS